LYTFKICRGWTAVDSCLGNSLLSRSFFRRRSLKKSVLRADVMISFVVVGSKDFPREIRGDSSNQPYNPFRIIDDFISLFSCCDTLVAVELLFTEGKMVISEKARVKGCALNHPPIIRHSLRQPITKIPESRKSREEHQRHSSIDSSFKVN